MNFLAAHRRLRRTGNPATSSAWSSRPAAPAAPVGIGRPLSLVQTFVWLHDTFDGIYPNPKNAIIVPCGGTEVVIDSEQLIDGRLVIHIRASNLRDPDQDLDPSDDLITHVALNCNDFHFGNLCLLSVEGGKYDLDYTNKVMSTWLPEPEDLVELVAVAGNNALNTASRLQDRFAPSQPVRGRVAHHLHRVRIRRPPGRVGAR